ncbi:MAG TPA: DUF3298 domain-containing protein [Firmicutes bacterium]|nr:DUF3298 domain-containing protein [Candidatus Fermentithermobacillaceae bacterium]
MSKRTTISLLAIAVFLSAVSVTAPSAKAGSNQISLWMNGELMSSVFAVLEGNTTMVDLITLCDALGFDLEREGDRATVTGRCKEVALVPGEGSILVNGCRIWVYPEPRQEDERILVPIRVLLENMGYRVHWVSRDLGVILTPIEGNTSISVTTCQEEIHNANLQGELQWPDVSGLPPEPGESLNRRFKDRLSSLIEEGRQAGEDLASAGIKDRKAEVIAGYRMMSNESGIVSILLSDYSYTGGAHGMTVRTGVTVNAETGRVYEFKDLFKAGSGYVDIINDEIKRQIEQRGMTELLLSPFETIGPDPNFYIKDDDLVVFFDLYEYTPYAFGFPEFKIPFALLGNVFSDKFARTVQPLIQESQLRQATADWLKSEQSSPGETLAFHALTDLNNDGLKDGLVLLGGPEWSGSGGNTLLVFEAKLKEQAESSSYAGFGFVSRTTLVNPPILMAEDTSDGWRDLYVYQSGEETQAGWVVLQFDGSGYPLNPSTQGKVFESQPFDTVKVF